MLIWCLSFFLHKMILTCPAFQFICSCHSIIVHKSCLFINSFQKRLAFFQLDNAKHCFALFHCFISPSTFSTTADTKQRRNRKNEKKVTHLGMRTCTHTDIDTASQPQPRTHTHTHPFNKEQCFPTVKRGGMTELLNRPMSEWGGGQ